MEANATLGRYSPPYRHPPAPLQDTTRRITTNSTGGMDMYGGLGDTMLARAQQLANADATKSMSHSTGSIGNLMRPDGLFGHADIPQHNPNMPTPRPQMSLHGFGGESMLEQLTNAHIPMGGIAPDPNGFGIASHGHTAQLYHNAHVVYSSHDTIATMNHNNMMTNSLMSPTSVDCTNHLSMAINNNNNSAQQHQVNPASMSPTSTSITPHPDMESDPRELEAFAEHFKQRRIKLGVTQADVGTALGKLKIPGVGSLSQSTICRFESLTLSHNNMIALKPVLQTWLEGAEAAARQCKAQAEAFNLSDKKRKRTSIAAPEKRSLEAYFAIQPRPSGEKIAQIAEKLDLKKNVVRVWFCNQRQKQKRMKFSATVQGQHSPIPSH